MTTTKQQRQIILSHSVENTKEVIHKICSLDKYMMEESNELTNTYKILMHEGFNTVVINTHLTSLTENKTDCVISINNIAGGSLPSETLTRLQNIYVKLLNDILEGKTVIKKRRPEPDHKKHILLKKILIIILIGIAVIVLIFLMMLEN